MISRDCLPDTTQVVNPSGMVFNMDGVKGQQIPMNVVATETYYQFYSVI